jgi:hypothetical protein
MQLLEQPVGRCRLGAASRSARVGIGIGIGSGIVRRAHAKSS